jgi:hypothetical protein
MGKKFKITEDQLKRLVENKSRIQEQNEGYVDEEIDGPSKEEYMSRHGKDSMSGELNMGLPDSDHDDETYDELNESIQKIKSQFKRFL